MPERLETKIEGVVLLEPAVHGDERGFMVETFRSDSWAELGVDVEFVQHNHSRSSKGTLRGLHFQTEPGQAKLVRCPRGAIFDVAVDLRRGSPTFGQWEGHVLDDEKHRQLFVPAGFAHGFAVLSDVADVAYLLSSTYDPATEAGIAWNDPDVGVEWPIAEPLLSERDKSAPRLSELGEALFPELSVVVLCYRGEDAIEGLIESLHGELSSSGEAFELILVANYWEGQEDRTPEVAERLAARLDHIRVIAQPKQGAMGWDMRAGLDATRGRAIVVLDGDGQNRSEDVLRVAAELRNPGAAIVKGRRDTRLDGWHRRFLSKAYNAIFQAMFPTEGIWDVNGKPKGMTRAALSQLNLSSDDWFIDAEIVLEARRLGLSIRDVPVVFDENTARRSFVRVGAIWEFVKNLVAFRLRGAR